MDGDMLQDTEWEHFLDTDHDLSDSPEAGGEFKDLKSVWEFLAFCCFFHRIVRDKTEENRAEM